MANLTAAQGLSACIIVVSLLSWLSPSTLQYTALIPFNTLTGHFFVWNLLTAGISESSPLSGLLWGGIVWWCGSKVEALWGTTELLKFAAVITLACSVSIFFTSVAIYISGVEGLFYMYFCGDVGVAAAMLVAMKQLHPDEFVVPGVPFRMKWLPLLLVSLSLAYEIVLPTHIPTDAEIGESHPSLQGTHVAHAVLGTFVGWFYLRFYQTLSSSANTPVGDPSEAFAFRTLFPEPLSRPVGILADITFAVASKVVCGFGQAVIEAEAEARRKQEEEQNPFFSEPVSTVADVRRQIALQALQDRLHQASNNDSSGLDAFDIEAQVGAPPPTSTSPAEAMQRL
ncbi:Rhomboid-like protein 19 [Diplonema papillatum]|nr:Rhomboid-like protein 19 [Diplonema papillatum]